MTRDRTFSPEVMGMNLVPYMRALQKLKTRFTVTYFLESVRRESDSLIAVIGSDYGGIRNEQSHDQVIINNGTLPFDELYFQLRSRSSNRGEVDYARLIEGIPQPAGASDQFQLFRIGDAVASRNTHAAIYDALRLVKDL